MIPFWKVLPNNVIVLLFPAAMQFPNK